MATDSWVPTHQGIAFNTAGELVDGQHRLHALILSGKTIVMMVTFGLPIKIAGKEMTTMDAIDRGKTRSVADQLKIQHGLKNGALIAAICASLGGLCYGERTRRLSVGQTLETYRIFEDSVTWVILHRSRQHGLRMVGVLAAFAMALATEEGFFDGASPIACMYDKLMNGAELESGSPIQLLRGVLTSDEAKLLSRGYDRGIAELVLQAIFLEASNQRVSKLAMSVDGVNHFRGRLKTRVEKVSALFQIAPPSPLRAA
jgi:hypothetical protein